MIGGKTVGRWRPVWGLRMKLKLRVNLREFMPEAYIYAESSYTMNADHGNVTICLRAVVIGQEFFMSLKPYHISFGKTIAHCNGVSLLASWE